MSQPHRKFASAFLLSAALQLLPDLSAQSASGNNSSAASRAERRPDGTEDVIVLSPFEVKGDSNVGYQATDTLAGTRIRTDLRDVGSAISVATKEFMQDIGATNSESLLQYMTSMEVGGSSGNFMVGSLVGDASVIDDAGARLKPQSNTRVRGLDSADNTRDFFATDIPWDSYNTSRIDVQRGANSILFGNGSGAGIINGATDAASLGKNSGTFGTRIDGFGSFRTSLNINHVLLKRELAVRFAALNNERKYEQKPAFNHDKRYDGALRYDPKFLQKGNARTSIKVSFESGEISANRPRLNTINDAVFPWFIQAPVELRSATPLGRPAGRDNTLLGVMLPMVSHDGYDPFVTGLNTTSLIAANPNRRDIGARATISTANPNAEGWLGALIKPSDQGGSQLAPNIDGGGLPFWEAVYGDPSSSTLTGYYYPTVTTYQALNSAGVRDGTINGLRGPDMTGLLRLDSYASRGIGSFLYALQGVWRSKTVSDPSVFDYYHKLLDGPNKAEGSKFHAFNASIDQTFLNDKVGFQLAVDQQSYSDYQVSNLSRPTLRIDIYKYLPIALPNLSTGLLEPVLNPNFGRPFVISKPSASRSRNQREVARLTPYINLDFRDILKSEGILTKVLGRHTLTGLYERSKFERTTSSWMPSTLDQDQATTLFGPNQSVSDSTRAIGTVTYLGPSLLRAPTLTGANLSAITAVEQPGMNGTNTTPLGYYYDATYAKNVSPSTSFTPPPLGLAPNQIGGGALTQSENPLSYTGWGAPQILKVTTAANGNEANLTTNATQIKNKVYSEALVDQWSLLHNYIIVTAGVRKDRIDTYYPGDPSLPANAPSRTGTRPTFKGTTGVVDWTAPFAYAGSPTYSFTSPWMKTYGAVFHLPKYISQRTPFGLETSIFFNRSENFRPENRNSPINGSSLNPPTGTTREIGLAFATPARKFSLKLNWFQTKVKNASLPDNGVIDFMADEVVQGLRSAKQVIYTADVNNGTNVSGGNPGLAINNPGSSGVGGTFMYRASSQPSGGTNLDPADTHWYAWQPSRPATAEQPWVLQDWKDAETHAIASATALLNSFNTPDGQQFLKTWQINPSGFDYHASSWNISSIKPGGAAITGDTVSRGTEIELFYSPLSNWDVTVNVSKTFATRLNLAGDVSDWLLNRWALYNETYSGAEGGLLAGGLRWFSNGQGSANSANARFGRNGYRFFSEFHSKEGINVPELRPWRANLVTSYRFKKGLLKGAFIGGSYRWEQRSVVGYHVIETDPELFITTSAGVQSARAAVGRLDPTQPFYGPAESHVGVWVGYACKVTKFVDWKVQLNVNNVGEYDRLIPVSVNPDGSGAAYRIAQGTNWELSNTFNF